MRHIHERQADNGHTEQEQHQDRDGGNDGCEKALGFLGPCRGKEEKSKGFGAPAPGKAEHSGGKSDGRWQLTPVSVEEWEAWLRDQKQTAGVKGDDVYVQVDLWDIPALVSLIAFASWLMLFL
jgi:hypothetical protein